MGSLSFPIILTSMAEVCEEGHEILRVCHELNPDKTNHIINVLVTQLAKWIADRIRRALIWPSNIISGNFYRS